MPIETPSPDPHSYQPSIAASPRKSRTGLKVLLILGLGVGGVIGLVVLLFAAGVVFEMMGEETELSAVERELLLDIETLSGWLEYTPDPTLAKTYKKTYFDGSYELDYEYQDQWDDGAIYMNYKVNWEPKASDAVAIYLPSWQSARFGLKIGGGTGLGLEERNELFQWGEASRFGLITAGNDYVGNVFVGRSDHHVVSFFLSGFYVGDTETADGILTPFLQKLATYSPP